MSRIGKLPIELPQGVEVNVGKNNNVTVKGPKGELTLAINPDMVVRIEDGMVTVERPDDKKKHRAEHGLARTLIYNAVVGVTEGYKKELLIEGTGYRAQKNGKTLNLNLGFSHPIDLEDPEGVEVEVPNANTIIVSGFDKQKVGAHAAKIRSYREPEPYKGKGIRYSDEQIRRKVGKTGA